ncbi:MAG: extracellular solute-binding protein [Puniceicoccales bacterium]|jgi:ABC-type Fe3+ transport system substrate-binding protein|nr:extracellular solute-binding protein [Puniceicoccales bacterium]
MLDRKKLAIIALIILVVGVPFIFREGTGGVVPLTDAETVIIITAHNESLRQEYAIGFKKWYKARTGKDVNVDWRYQGGGRDAARYVESVFSNEFRLHWINNLRRDWDSGVAAAFAARSEKLLNSSDNTLVVEVTKKFFESNVGCGVDILFGGGVFEYEFQASKGNLVPCGILSDHPEMFSEDTIPEFLSGNRLWDANGRWFGGALSAFGIIYNSDAILDDGITFFPETWMDIGHPEFFGKLAIADPTKSSSTLKAFCMLVQQQMQICNDVMESGLGVETLSPEDEATAVADGWMNGLKLIQKIIANGRYFTESSAKPVVDVSSGNCLAGIAVNFYGSAEAKHLEERSGSKRFKFVMPRAGGAPSPDPIGVFRGAPNPKLAREFVEFVLSIDGQKMISFDLDTPGGPEKTTMRCVPILKTAYETQHDQYKCDPSVNPYKSAASFTSHNEWTDRIFPAIGIIIKLAFIDVSFELSDAMDAIIRARKDGRERDAEAAYAILSDMSDMNYNHVVTNIIPIFSSKDILRIAELQNSITEKYRRQYLLAKKAANP